MLSAAASHGWSAHVSMAQAATALSKASTKAMFVTDVEDSGLSLGVMTILLALNTEEITNYSDVLLCLWLRLVWLVDC